MVIAAGAAGLIKTALALRAPHTAADAALHVAESEDRFRAHAVPRPNATLTPWPRGRSAPRRRQLVRRRRHQRARDRRGGTARDASSAPDGPQVLVLSARSPAALRASAKRLADHLAATPDATLADVAYTLRGRPQGVRASRERRRRRRAVRDRGAARSSRRRARGARVPKSSSCSRARARSTPAWAARSTKANLSSATRSTSAPRSRTASSASKLTRRHVLGDADALNATELHPARDVRARVRARAALDQPRRASGRTDRPQRRRVRRGDARRRHGRSTMRSSSWSAAAG